MSVPFSNTHLRVPQGFSTILEGLAREVLRDQPEDIPKYAAQYFYALLRQREDSGIDPAEWAAKHEDTFYKKHAFKDSRASPEKEPVTEVTTSKEESCESQAEDESSRSADAANLSTTKPNASGDADLTESTDEYEDQHNLTEEDSINKLPAADLQPDDLSGTEEETDPTITAFDHIDREDNGRDSSSALDQDVPQFELERTDLLSFRGISNVDVCAQELRILEDEEGGEQKSVAVEEDIADLKGEENTDIEPVQFFPYSGLSDVDVCAAELDGTERAMEAATAKYDEHSSKHTAEETEDEDQVEERKVGVETEASSGAIYESLAPVEADLDINDIPKEEEGAETEASSSGGIHGSSAHIEADLDINDIPKEEERAETEASSSGEIHGGSAHIEAGVDINDIPKEEEGAETEASASGGIHGGSAHIEARLGNNVKQTEEGETETGVSFGHMPESSAHIEASLDNNPTPKEDSLVEISFDDVPEAQQFEDDEEKEPGEEGSVKVLHVLEMQQKEEFTEVSDVVTNENISRTPDMMKVEQEVNFEGAELESEQKICDIMKEKVDTNYSNLYYTDDETHEGVKTISSSHQPTTKADKENLEDETDRKNEDNEKVNESEFHQSEDSEKEAESNDPDFKGDETTDTVGGEEEDMPTGGYSEMDAGEIDDGAAENHSSQITHSEVSTAATEAEKETLEASAQHLAEVNGERHRTPVELEDTVVEKEVTSKERSSEAEELVEEGMIDSELQEKSDATIEEGSISLSQSADQLASDHHGEERPLGSEKESTEPEGKSGDEEDCSRPQEEEDIMDIPLDDPEANRAAAKIQAGFRGHMTRKKMKPEDKAEGEEVSSTGDVLNGSQGDTETGGSGAVERDATSVPEQ